MYIYIHTHKYHCILIMIIMRPVYPEINAGARLQVLGLDATDPAMAEVKKAFRCHWYAMKKTGI